MLNISSYSKNLLWKIRINLLNLRNFNLIYDQFYAQQECKNLDN